MTLMSTLRVGAVAAAVLLCCHSSAAQNSPIEASASPTSIGFEDPDDTATLLEYRLPDWGWRTWDATFDLGGSATDRYGGDDDRDIANRFSTRLGTRFDLYRESERRDWSTSGTGSGSYQRLHDGSTTSERSGHSLNTFLSLSGSLREYLMDGPLFLRVGGSLSHRYDEQVFERRRPEGVPDTRAFSRAQSLRALAGIGLGRVRDVTPLIRAQRLSERLAALGRPALTREQVREVANVLATEQGYRTVFERPDRSFWRDTLEPMLDPANPLSPYEIFYLRDVLNEDVGPRTQGASLQVVAVYDENRSSGGSRDSVSPRRSVGLVAGWYRNLSLNQQLRATGAVDFVSSGFGGRRGEYVNGRVQLAHLWTIADRYRWDNMLEFRSAYNDNESAVDASVRRDYVTTLRSEFRVFLEDRMAVLATIQGENRQEYAELVEPSTIERYRRRWGWTYGIGLEYRLDNFLY